MLILLLIVIVIMLAASNDGAAEVIGGMLKGATICVLIVVAVIALALLFLVLGYFAELISVIAALGTLFLFGWLIKSELRKPIFVQERRAIRKAARYVGSLRSNRGLQQ